MKQTKRLIDFRVLRTRIDIADVLRLLDNGPLQRSAGELRGRCPFGCSNSPRIFSAYLESNRYYCYHCRPSGNPIELWASLHGLSFYKASVDLCRHLQIEIPRL